MEEKTTDVMNPEEFNRWAAEYVVTEFLEKGIKGIKNSLRVVIICVCNNTVFGGKKA
jgi:hypothetical protein